jgi:hypothetical protein
MSGAKNTHYGTWRIGQPSCREQLAPSIYSAIKVMQND